jgi:uncharacterized protein YndB with AHSA1/START domain
MSPTTHTDGTLETSEGRDVIRFERRLSHPIEKVWSALTEPEELAGWLAEADLELVEGGPIELRWLNTDDQGNSTVVRGAITELDPPHVIEYDTDVHGVLRWELREDGDACVLKFSSRLSLPDDYRTKNLAGWHWHLDRLEDELAGHPYDWSRWAEEGLARWGSLHERYVAGLAG